MAPELESARLWLRPWRADEADAAFAIYAQWDVARFLGATPKAWTEPAEADAAIARWGAVPGPVHGIWAIVPQGETVPVGTMLLKLLPFSSGATSADTEIGWHLRPDVWGRGYATEAAHRILEHAWAYGLAEVFAVTYPDNGPSQRVCERIGMTRLGPTERYYGVTCELFRIGRTMS
jgi:RimJ/RimL family protein N-acetyltransferase